MMTGRIGDLGMRPRQRAKTAPPHQIADASVFLDDDAQSLQRRPLLDLFHPLVRPLAAVIHHLLEQFSVAETAIVVALSQDDNSTELAEVRKLVEQTLAQKKINLTGGQAGRIGLDPSKSVGSAFEVEGYPTLVILDGKGIVKSVHVGFNPDAAEPLSKTLAKEIDTLLEGKSLAGPKDKSNEASKKDVNEKP